MADSADAPLPETTPGAVAEKARQAMKDYEAGVVEATYVESRVRGDVQPPQAVAWDGRFEYATDGYRWHGEYEGKSYSAQQAELHPRGWYAGFDGDVHFRHELNSAFVLGEEQAHEGIPILELIWSSHGAGFPRSLVEDDWRVAGQEALGGHRCYVLVRDAQLPNFQQRQELTVSPRQNWLPVRYQVFSNGELSWSHELLDLARTESGVWYPRKVRKVQTWLSNRILEATIGRFESDPFFDAAYFRPRIPWGIHVRDWRTGEVYKSDPWWPEVEPLVREQLDWPPPDFMPLQNVASHVDPAMQGRPAPLLAVGEWISGGPVSLDERRGKVTLLFFSGGSLWSPNPEWVSGLRDLYDVYKPLGLEIIGINTHSNDLDAARQQVRELRIGWPVAVDAEGGSLGKTFDVYGLQTYLSTVLVDHEGTIHLVQQGGLPAKVKELLESAGAKEVAEISLQYQSIRYDREITDAWRTIVRNSPRPVKIAGTVRDHEGPLAGVRVEGNLRLELAGSIHTTGATTIVPYREEAFRATTGEAGTYEIGELCKGTYLLRFALPGRAAVERRVVIAPGENELVVNADLTQRDGIVGRVVDGAGNPIDGAKVTIRHRHIDTDNPSFISTYNAEPSVTDAEGRFRFEKLQTGAYTLDVRHPDFLDDVLEMIPAGVDDAIVVLRKRDDKIE